MPLNNNAAKVSPASKSNATIRSGVRGPMKNRISENTTANPSITAEA